MPREAIYTKYKAYKNILLLQMINSLLIFTFITVLFGTVKYLTRKQPNVQSVMLLMYVLMVAGMQFYVNFNYIQQKCDGKGDYGKAFFSTIVPFVLIFMVVFLLLRTFPYWKMPFSSTFGYLLARLMGIKKVLLEYILKPTSSVSSEKTALSKSLTMIYEDPSLLINSLTPDNMRDFTQHSQDLFRTGAEEHFNKLYDFIIMKDIVSEYLWYYLTGILITAYSVANIASLKCNVSASEMIKLHRLHVENHKKHIENTDPSNKKIYSLSE